MTRTVPKHLERSTRVPYASGLAKLIKNYADAHDLSRAQLETALAAVSAAWLISDPPADPHKWTRVVEAATWNARDRGHDTLRKA